MEALEAAEPRPDERDDALAGCAKRSRAFFGGPARGGSLRTKLGVRFGAAAPETGAQRLRPIA